ncbi:MAG: glycoside hydrolase family 66 protein [Alicyclobacillus sp.]|nr:glycoside hydrolase family 66 protein [Alicyclobacillus sp.]
MRDSEELREQFDVFPEHTQFRPGQPVRVVVQLPRQRHAGSTVRVTVHRQQVCVAQVAAAVTDLERSGSVLDLGTFPEGGYHIRADLSAPGQPATGPGSAGEAMASTAFDVRRHWRDAPRYGFLCEFNGGARVSESGPFDPSERSGASAPEKEGGEGQPGAIRDEGEVEADGLAATRDFFRRFHLNVVQFYDWMERHDALVPTAPEFVDPMGRLHSTSAITDKLRMLREVQAASVAYAAVYAALKDYADRHPEWGLYDNAGVQQCLIDRFYLMDISAKTGWTEHILRQFAEVMSFGFDGLHLDQYGFPKTARRQDGSSLWMDGAYAGFVEACRDRLGPEAGLIFNNVSSYPVHRTALSPVDAVYIEVWPPMTRYRHLADCVIRARLTGQRKKAVILAAYLKCLRRRDRCTPDAAARSALLLTAVIHASGGYHLLLGECYGVLTEAYYPDYVPMVPELREPLRRMYDVLTADADLWYGPDAADVTWSFAGGINDEVRIEGAPFSVEAEAGKLWVRVLQTARGLVIHLVNLLWVQDDAWDAVHEEPFAATPPLSISVEWNHPLQGVWVQRAESPGWQSVDVKLSPHVRGRALSFTVPSFDIWSMVWIPHADTAGNEVSE